MPVKRSRRKRVTRDRGRNPDVRVSTVDAAHTNGRASRKKRLHVESHKSGLRSQISNVVEVEKTQKYTHRSLNEERPGGKLVLA